MHPKAPPSYDGCPLLKAARGSFALAAIAAFVWVLGLLVAPPGASVIGVYAAAGVAFFLVVGILLLVRSLNFRRHARKKILTQGEPANAEILHVETRATPIVRTPVTCLRLKVMPLDREPFETWAEELVPRLDVIRMQPGAMIRVRYLPDEREVVVVEA